MDRECIPIDIELTGGDSSINKLQKLGFNEYCGQVQSHKSHLTIFACEIAVEGNCLNTKSILWDQIMFIMFK